MNTKAASMPPPTPTKMGENPKYQIGKKAIDLLPAEYIAAISVENLRKTLNQAKMNELFNELEGLTEMDLSDNDFVSQATAIINKYVTVVNPSIGAMEEQSTEKSLTADSGTRGDWWDTLDDSKKVGILVGGVAVLVGIAYVTSKLQN
jgi:hypothetical protein